MNMCVRLVRNLT